MNFGGSKYLFQLNLVCIGDSRIGFCPALFWKQELNLRGSHCSCSMKKGVFRSFVNFTGKHLYWSLFLIKLQAKRLKHRCSPVEFTKFLKTEVYERLLLKPVVSPEVSFLISYICGSNWYMVFVSYFTILLSLLILLILLYTLFYIRTSKFCLRS